MILQDANIILNGLAVNSLDEELIFLIKRYEKDIFSAKEDNDLRSIFEIFGLKKWKCLFFCSNSIKEEYIRSMQQMKQFISFYITEEIPKSIYLKECNHMLETALYESDKYPYVLCYHSETEFFSMSLNDHALVVEIIQRLEQDEKAPSLPKKEDTLLFFHLSDFHLGNNKHRAGKYRLIEVLDREISILNPKFPIKIIMTGDIMDSPNNKNMYLATEFLGLLKRRYQVDMLFVLGNHDVIVNGVNLLRRQKSKVIAYLLKDTITIYEQQKIIMIQLNSNMAGSLARGKIGERQLKEVEKDLAHIPNINEYTIMAMMHHHLLPIDVPDDFSKNKKHSFSLVRYFMDKTKILVDSKQVLDWLHQNNVTVIFHGHKHIPAIKQDKNMAIIGAGSSMGIIRNKSGSYISYNLVKYDVRKREILFCFHCYEDIKGKHRNVYMEFLGGIK